MRILVDEDLPRRLGALLVGHEASTVQRSGWSGIKNGKLLALAAARFDVFLTMDGNLEFQQNLATLPIAVLVSATPAGYHVMLVVAAHVNIPFVKNKLPFDGSTSAAPNLRRAWRASSLYPGQQCSRTAAG